MAVTFNDDMPASEDEMNLRWRDSHNNWRMKLGRRATKHTQDNDVKRFAGAQKHMGKKDCNVSERGK